MKEKTLIKLVLMLDSVTHSLLCQKEMTVIDRQLQTRLTRLLKHTLAESQ